MMLPRLFLTLLFTWLVPLVALALEPERRDVIVVTGRIWDGFAYKETFLPSTTPELRLLGDKDSAIAYVRTKEYYWPLSRQVYVDLESERQDIEGVLRISLDGKVVADIHSSPYSIIYPEGAVNGNGTLAWGDKAVSAFAEYQNAEREFARRFVAAQQSQTAYERKLLETGAARNRGENVEPVDPPEPLPEPSLRLVTKPVPAFRIDLAPGRYQMVLVRDGKEVPGTARALQIVTTHGRRTLVADIIPEERWTRPIASNSNAARVFVRPGSVFYATLAEADRYLEDEYLPVITPQAIPVIGRTMWVRRKPSAIDSLIVDWDEKSPKTLPLDPLKVEQTEGSGFGYRVRFAKSGEKEDLKAFQIAVPDDPAIERGHFSFGKEADLAREIIIVHPRNPTLALALTFLPLLTWGGLVTWRRRRRGTA